MALIVVIALFVFMFFPVLFAMARRPARRRVAVREVAIEARWSA
jgi:hypothetical protein